MTKADILRFFGLQRQIFGICPRSGQFFRLSECRIFQRERSAPDWLERLTQSARKLTEKEYALDEGEEELREKARKKGRRQALSHIKRLDRVFGPRRLNPDDARVLFHPVDYIVFNGLNGVRLRSVVLLDRSRPAGPTQLQESIRTAVEKERYEWKTVRIMPTGAVEIK